MLDEEITSGSGAGAGENAEALEAGQTSQEAGQSQSSEGTQKVGSAPTEPSSRVNVESLNKIIDKRIGGRIEKAIAASLQAQLQEKLAPILDSMRSNVPQGSQGQAQDDVPDYNDLSGWINRRVNSLLQERLQKEIPATLNQFKGQLTNTLKSEAHLQEARNYLISQKDIGRDQTKLDEIKQVIEDNLWGYALEHEPLRTTEKAVEEWRRMKSNPNAPARGQLAGVSGGGAGQTAVKEPATMAQLKALQNRLSRNPTIEEMEKINGEIESILSA